MTNEAAHSRLNQEFFERLFRHNEEQITVIGCEVKPAVPKGNNYLGTLYRASIEYKILKLDNTEYRTENHSFIIKIPPDTEHALQYCNHINAFCRESIMYKIILPEMYKIVDETATTNRDLRKRLTPRYFYCGEEDKLVLEDLQPLGYVMADRYRQLDLKHATAVLRALGRFHAMSVAVHQREPSIMANVREEQFTEDIKDIERDFISYRYNLLASEIEKWPGFEHYANKIRENIEVSLDKLIEIVKPTVGSLSVLNHGDCWVNNILFHYDSDCGEIDAIKFIDFQMYRFSSPALDLQFFMYTSVREEIRTKHLEAMLREYYDQFSSTLKTLGCDPDCYSFQQLKREFEEKEYFGFITVCSKMTLVLEEPLVLQEENSEYGGVKLHDHQYSEDKGQKTSIREIFEKLLPYFEEKGFL
ncbi:uncharacterized protein [Periplaneta americana]|uniref:uncharacterized protein isoform X3 n=1 Tax=Periplaneta americana TaxID=6978 RepID=UPI0037E98701